MASGADQTSNAVNRERVLVVDVESETRESVGQRGQSSGNESKKRPCRPWPARSNRAVGRLSGCGTLCPRAESPPYRQALAAG